MSQQVDFTAFAQSGDLLWDYEYFLRRGLGRVRVEPIKGQKVGSLVINWLMVESSKSLRGVVKKGRYFYFRREARNHNFRFLKIEEEVKS